MVKRLPEGVTQLFEKWSQGDEEALDRLLPLVYDELHRLAGAYLRRERHEHTLQPTALVSEAFLKLRPLKYSTAQIVRARLCYFLSYLCEGIQVVNRSRCF